MTTLIVRNRYMNTYLALNFYEAYYMGILVQQHLSTIHTIMRGHVKRCKITQDHAELERCMRFYNEACRIYYIFHASPQRLVRRSARLKNSGVGSVYEHA